MSIITAVELEGLGACKEGYDLFIEKNGSEATYLEALESNGIDDVLWYFDETDKLTMSQQEDLQQLINGYALVNIELIKPYTSSSNYDCIVAFLEGDESKREVAWAARAAWVAMAAGGAGGARAAWAARAAGGARAAWAARAAGGARSAAGAAWGAWGAREAAGELQTKQLREMLEKWLAGGVRRLVMVAGSFYQHHEEYMGPQGEAVEFAVNGEKAQ